MPISPQVIQTYRLSNAAVAQKVSGLTLCVAGWAQDTSQMFDVIEAINTANDNGQISVCDNGLKQALDDCPLIVRVS